LAGLAGDKETNIWVKIEWFMGLTDMRLTGVACTPKHHCF